MGYADVLQKEYNPYIHRERPGQLGRINALISLIKGILGTGILALPDAFKKAGWGVGTVACVIVHLLVCYCLHIMFTGMLYMSKRNEVPYVSYADSFGKSLQIGPKFLRNFESVAPSVITFFIILYQFGTLCVYMVFISSNVKMVLDDNTEEDGHIGLWCYMTVSLVPLLLLTYIKNLKLLAPFSNAANWLTLASLIIVYYFVFEQIESLGDRNFHGTATSTALFVGTTMFAILSIGVMLSIELNMKDGSQWLGMFGVLNQAVFVVTILDTLTGLFGYWRYGDDIEPSVTLSLGKNPAAWSVQILYGCAILVSYALQAYPMIEICWDLYIKQHMETSEHIVFWDYSMRTIVVLLSFLIAVPIPFLGLFISLCGSLCLSFLGIIFPPLMDICIRWEDSEFGAGKMYLIRDVGFICLGFFACGIGCYSAIEGMVLKFLE